MIITDTKNPQAKTAIPLSSLAGVSVTSFQDGLFSLHLSEVSEPGGGRAQPGEGGGHYRARLSWRRGGPDISLWAFDISQAAPRRKNESLPCYFLPSLRSPRWAPRGTSCWSVST